MQYAEKSLVSTGPVMASVAVGEGNATLIVTYVAGTAGGLHTAPTADCDKIGSKLCCGESPFQAGTTKGIMRANYTIKTDGTVMLGPLDGGTLFTNPPVVTYAWEQ